MKLLIIECAALSYELWKRHKNSLLWKNFTEMPLTTIFPALTCPVQASFRTALSPALHGITANGFYDRKLHKTFFWEQSADLYTGRRIWKNIRNTGGKAGEIYWQQSIGEDIDLILSPAPVHKHHGGMIQDVYSYLIGDDNKPTVGKLYKEICDSIGYSFNLFNYWGPFVSIKSTKWIVDATIYCMDNYFKEDKAMLLTYLPYLDYELQRSGPDGDKINKEFKYFESEFSKLLDYARKEKWEVVVFGDYAINNVSKVIFPNKILRQHEMMFTRNIKGMLYPDLYQSPAFALTDHQIAHIFVKNRKNNIIDEIVKLFDKIEEIEEVIVTSADNELSGNNLYSGIAGDIILVAKDDAWFAYQWWDSVENTPDYASHVDIHNKPGFDPCELFFSLWPPFSISQDANKVKGSHGKITGDRNLVLCASTFTDIKKCKTIIDLAELVENIC